MNEQEIEQAQAQAAAQGFTDIAKKQQSLLQDAETGFKESFYRTYGYKPKKEEFTNPYASVINFERQTPYLTIKYDNDSDGGIKVGADWVEMRGGPDNAVMVGQNYGVIVKGKVAFTNMPGDIQFAGLWRFNNMLMSTVPSTIMSPTSTLDFRLPFIGMTKALKDTVAKAAIYFASVAV